VLRQAVGVVVMWAAGRVGYEDQEVKSMQRREPMRRSEVSRLLIL
jgi:hypothetical protein